MKTQSAAVMESTHEPEPKHSSEEISNQFSQIHDALARRAFDIFESRGRSPGHELEDWSRAESELLHPVPVKRNRVKRPIYRPGGSAGIWRQRSRGHGETALSENFRQTRNEGSKENGKMICSDSRADRIFRVVDLPSVVDTSKVSTILKDGILIVDLPKAQNAEEVRVEPIAT